MDTNLIRLFAGLSLKTRMEDGDPVGGMVYGILSDGDWYTFYAMSDNMVVSQIRTLHCGASVIRGAKS